MHVCSNHFKEEDYLKTGAKQRKHFKKTAVPSLNLPKRSHDAALKTPEKQKINARAKHADKFKIARELKMCENLHSKQQDDIQDASSEEDDLPIMAQNVRGK